MNRDAHLQDVVRLWLGLPEGAEAPALPAHLAALLLRDEERATPHRDPWGCWEFPFSDNHHRGALLVPEIDIWLAVKRAGLTAAGAALEPLWPEGRPFALAVSHDVDDFGTQVTPRQWARQALLRLGAGQGAKGRLKALAEGLPATLWQARTVRSAPDLGATLEKLLDIEAEFGIAASYFFTVWPPGRRSPYDCVPAFDDPCVFRGRRTAIAAVIRAVAASGHDVGLHGSYWSAIDDGALAAEKRALERLLGAAVVSTRQHWLHWRVDRTPRLQDAAGFKVDGTLGFNGTAGFRAGTSLPFPLWDGDRRLDLLAVPLALMDTALFRPGAMGLDLELARRLVERLVEKVAAAGGLVSLLVHPSHLADPKVEALLRWTLGHCLTRGAWPASHAAIAAHWRGRARRLSRPPSP